MIKVNFRTHDATKYLSLTVEGHAGADARGHDLVCASASILAYTVAQVVTLMERNGELDGKSCIEMSEGNATIIFRCKSDETYATAKHTFYVAETGYFLLAHNYPQNVEVKSVGQAEKP